MPLLGKAAMLLSFDVVEDAIPEHDEWHTHEHLPERLSIPGFVRGTRWVSLNGKPRYFVMYEVEQLATLQSEAYLERLNNPSPWTSRMMPNYRGMTRGFCSVSGSLGVGMGQVGLLIRFKPETGTESSLRAWLLNDTLPQLPSRRGLGSAHLFEGALTPDMTMNSEFEVLMQELTGRCSSRDTAKMLWQRSCKPTSAAINSSSMAAQEYPMQCTECNTC